MCDIGMLMIEQDDVFLAESRKFVSDAMARAVGAGDPSDLPHVVVVRIGTDPESPALSIEEVSLAHGCSTQRDSKGRLCRVLWWYPDEAPKSI